MTNLSRIFIERPVMTIMVMVFFLMMGLMSYWKLPVSDLPNVDYPAITVTVNYPGNSPETMANTIATPLEKQFMIMDGVSNITSQNTLGKSQIVIIFDLKKSMDSAASDVQAAIQRAMTDLPSDLPNSPTYQKINPSDTPIMYIAMTSESVDLAELYKFGFSVIAQRLSMTPGVAQVMVYGSSYATRVDVDPYQISTMNMTLGEVNEMVQASTPELPTGQLDGHKRSWIVKTDFNLQNAKEFDPVVLKWEKGAPVRIQDVGGASDSLDNTRINIKYFKNKKGMPAIILAIQKQPGANTVEIAKMVRDQLPKLLDLIPPAIEMEVMYDKAVSIKASIIEVQETLLIAFILVVIVIFAYLGSPMDTFIPSISMPMSIIITFWAMEVLGYSIDNLSMLGLILATGFIVDDAIVVLENIVHHMEKGMDRWTASLEGSRLISFTILSMTLSLAAVFIPLVYMEGLIGKLFREFSIVMVIVVLASGFVSLTLTPMLCSRFIVLRDPNKKGFSDRFNKWMLDHYHKSLIYILNFRKTTLAVGFLCVLFSAIFLYKLPKDFLPDDDMGFIQGFTQSAQGTAPDQMFKLQDEIATLIDDDPDVNSVISISGFPQTNQGILYLNLVDANKRQSKNTLLHLQKKATQVPGIQAFLKNIPMINMNIGSESRGAYQYTMQSLDSGPLYKATDTMVNRMQQLRSIWGVNSDVQIETPRLDIKLDRDQASALGIDAKSIERTLGGAYSGNRTARIYTPLDLYDVILQVPLSDQRNAKDVDALYLRSSTTGKLVPFNSFATTELGFGASQINHFDQFPSATIAFNLSPNVALGEALKEIDEIAKDVVPSEVLSGVKGAAEVFAKSVSSLGILFIFAIFAIYIILGILYESFIHPLTILSSLPPAIFGGLLTLELLGLPLNLYGYLGLILLIGIVKKNGIMMVDYAIENKRHYHENSEQSIIDAALARFRPIMMTTFAAIMGALPIALASGTGAIGRRPLGYVIIGGLLVSQLITLYLTPVIYLYLDKWSEKFSFSNDVATENS